MPFSSDPLLFPLGTHCTNTSGIQGGRNLTASHRRRNPRHRPLRIEPLEDRRLLASLTVNSLLDNTSSGDGLVTLREAIVAANTDATTDLGHTGSGADTIEFAASLTSGGPATILLTQGELQISAALTINGPGPNLLTVDAQQASRILNITAATGNFTVRGITLIHGRTIGDNGTLSISTFSGGAIRSVTTGSLTIDQCNISENSTSGERAAGGGIFTERALTITLSTVSGNSTAGTDARGGGIRTQFGGLTLTNSTVSGNSTTGSGSRGGGISADTSVTLVQSTVSGNSTVGSNADGGGMRIEGTLTLTHSTVNGNSANGSGARGGGVWGSVFDPVTMANSIVAGNTASGVSPDLGPSTPTATFSLIGDKSGTSLVEAPVGSPSASGNLIGGPVNGVINPLLGPLTDNGGPTLTRALLAGSPAIDGGRPGRGGRRRHGSTIRSTRHSVRSSI